MAELWLIALIAVLLLLRRKERYTPLALARAVMIVKLVQIPAYAGILLLGLGFSLTGHLRSSTWCSSCSTS